MEVFINSLNIRINSRKRNGQFAGALMTKIELALIMTKIRYDIFRKFSKREFVVDDEAIDYLIKSLNVAIKANFGGGEAQLRRPNKWIGAAKSNLIYLFP